MSAYVRRPEGAHGEFRERKKMNLKLTISLAMVAGLAFSGSVRAAVPTVDGFLSAGEYSNSFDANWYNGHNPAGSVFPSGGQTTKVWWQDVTGMGAADGLYVGIGIPIEAKNMAWGIYNPVTHPKGGFSKTPGSMAYDEALLYYHHWCSPSSGAPALDGSNCNHHSNGFNSSNFALDYNMMTGSEKLEIGSFTADFPSTEAGSTLAGFSILGFADSIAYVIANRGCNTTDCNAYDVAMAFEFKFGSLTAAQRTTLFDYMTSNEFNTHLSPERGGPAPIPEPSTYALMLAGLGLLGWVGRRRKSKAPV